MQSTLLVNEAFLRLANAKVIDWQDRKHFFAVAARSMRRFLIDRARSKQTVVVLPIEDLPEALANRHTPIELELSIDEVLNELEVLSVNQCRAVELKHYMGLTDEEAAAALELKVRTFQRTLRAGKRWLLERLSAEPCQPQTNATSV